MQPYIKGHPYIFSLSLCLFSQQCCVWTRCSQHPYTAIKHTWTYNLYNLPLAKQFERTCKPRGQVFYKNLLSLLFSPEQHYSCNRKELWVGLLAADCQFHRYYHLRCVKERPQDSSVSSPNLPSRIINNSKWQKVWYMRAKHSLLSPSCVNILTLSTKTGMNPKGTLPHKVFFHVLQSECYLSLYIHEIELRGSHREGTVCSDRLTNLTTDWLGKWLRSMPRVSSFLSVSPASSFYRPLFICNILAHLHLPQQKEKSGRGGHYSYEEEKVTHRVTESWRDEGSKNKTNRVMYKR